jgi:hypothetical protein
MKDAIDLIWVAVSVAAYAVILCAGFGLAIGVIIGVPLMLMKYLWELV